MDKTLYIIRGASGSGKTTLATTLSQHLPNAIAISADDYFYTKEGNYVFDVSSLSEAHQYCSESVEQWMELDKSNVIIHNTSTREWEFQPYIDMAHQYGYKVVSLVVENRHGNSSVHNVPEEVVENHRNNILNNLKL